jgi:hypothetical protein
MYLYARDAKEDQSKLVKKWERAVKFSKYITRSQDKEALSMVVQRVSGNIVQKGWDALMCYSKEISTMKAETRSIAMRLMKADLSRGWIKMKLMWKSQREREAKRQRTEQYALKVLTDKMTRITEDTAKSASSVRSNVINDIQSKFRTYRCAKIFDRVYPLGTRVNTRMQQARQG